MRFKRVVGDRVWSVVWGHRERVPGRRPNQFLRGAPSNPKLISGIIEDANPKDTIVVLEDGTRVNATKSPNYAFRSSPSKAIRDEVSKICDLHHKGLMCSRAVLLETKRLNDLLKQDKTGHTICLTRDGNNVSILIDGVASGPMDLVETLLENGNVMINTSNGNIISQ